MSSQFNLGLGKFQKHRTQACLDGTYADQASRHLTRYITVPVVLVRWRVSAWLRPATTQLAGMGA